MLNPKVDVVFRKLLGGDENKDLLISLINSVVSPTPLIRDVVIKNPFNLADYERERESILDIKAQDDSGVWYDIEMKIASHPNYGRRAFYYLSKMFSAQISAGEEFSALKTTIGIHFLDFSYFPEDRVLRQYILKDADTDETHPELSCARLYFVEMVKFSKEWAEVRTGLDRWVAFLNRARDLSRVSLPVELAQEPAVVKAVTKLEQMGLNRRERAIYEGELKAQMLDATQIREAEETGKRQGIELGLQQGVRGFVLRLAADRFGELPANLRSRIERLDAEKLQELGLALLKFGSVNDFNLWLTRH